MYRAFVVVLTFGSLLVAQPLKTTASHKMTEKAYNDTVKALDAYLDPIRKTTSDRNQPFYLRDWATPYHLIHQPGTMVRGSVILFHGFTSRPHQFAVLADYLHQAGFNVWNAGLPNHHLQPRPDKLTEINATMQWPQEVLVDKYRLPLLKLYANEEKRNRLMATFLPALAHRAELSEAEQLVLIGQVQKQLDEELGENSPSVVELMDAMNNPDSKAYDKYYHAGHRLYLEAAKAHLDRLKALPGPVYAIGLSVGGTVALALAAAEPERIAGVVSYAPLLQTFGSENRMKVKIAGPSNQIDAQNRGAIFNVSSYAATEALGAKVLGQYKDKDFRFSVFMVLTHGPLETAAEPAVSKAFFEGLKVNKKFLHEYDSGKHVPHAMVDPKEKTSGISNGYWESLYRETLRFIADSEAVTSKLGDPQGDNDLPQPVDERKQGFTPDA